MNIVNIDNLKEIKDFEDIGVVKDRDSYQFSVCVSVDKDIIKKDIQEEDIEYQIKPIIFSSIDLYVSIEVYVFAIKIKGVDIYAELFYPHIEREKEKLRKLKSYMQWELIIVDNVNYKEIARLELKKEKKNIFNNTNKIKLSNIKEENFSIYKKKIEEKINKKSIDRLVFSGLIPDFINLKI